jgi:hypothetical protein
VVEPGRLRLRTGWLAAGCLRQRRRSMSPDALPCTAEYPSINAGYLLDRIPECLQLSLGPRPRDGGIDRETTSNLLAFFQFSDSLRRDRVRTSFLELPDPDLCLREFPPETIDLGSQLSKAAVGAQAALAGLAPAHS